MVLSYNPNSPPFQKVDRVLRKQDQIIHILQDNLQMERNQMKQQADQHHYKCTFQVNYLVLFHLQPYK